MLAFLAGGCILAAAQSAIHEIEAFILFLISAVLLVGASVVEAIIIARKKMESLVQAALVRPAAPMQPVSAPQPQQVVPPEPASRPYYFSADGKDSGPHSLDEMRLFRKSGKLTDEILVIRQGDIEWQPASMFPEICC